MKKIFAAVLIFNFTFLVFNSVYAQAPSIEWAKCYGGSKEDYAMIINRTSDGGFIIGGDTKSNDGNADHNHDTSGTSTDLWIVKIDSLGNIIWRKCLGGSNEDNIASIEQMVDGGYFISATVGSIDGDVSGNQGSFDFWVAKTDSNGNILWQYCYGGNDEELAYYGEQTTDGGFIVSGVANSNNGNVSGNHGSADVWVVKLDSAGALQWQKCYGGTNGDGAFAAKEISNHRYIIGGTTFSSDGDVTGYHGGLGDCWILLLDSVGNLLWEKCFGGTKDEECFSICETYDGGFIFTGETNSNDGDVSGIHGSINSDTWVVKLDSLGNLQWQKCLGGTADETPRSIIQANDSGYIIASWARSDNGDVIGNHSPQSIYADYWIVKLDSLGSIEWQKCLGGTDFDGAMNILSLSSDSYIIAGFANSNNGDVSGNHGGGGDCWIVKLGSVGTDIADNNNLTSTLTAHFSSANNLAISFVSFQLANLQLTIQDITGRILFQSQLATIPGINKKEIYVGDLAKGIYIVTLSGEEGRESVKVIKGNEE